MATPKPDYLIPTMAEIAATPPNGRTVASLFSGCGGSSLGYRIAGFRVLYANEFIPAARDSYAANKADYTVLDPRDIRDVTGASILEAIGLDAGELDLLDGSPPCASFSTAGQRQRHWGEVKQYSDTQQRTDDLFFEFARLVDELRPRVFVAENVSGLVKGVAKGYFLEILAALKALGYRVSARVLDAQWLGVPQARERLIYVGVREDLALDPVHPRPLSYRYSIRDAIPWIVNLRRDSGGQEGSRVFDPAREPMASLRAGGGGAQKAFTLEVDEELVAVEGANGFNGHARQSLDQPSPTIQATRAVRAFVRTGKGNRGVDAPAPTVMSHNRPDTRSELTIRYGNKAPFDSKGKAISPDRPLPTVIASDKLGLAPYQFEIETPAVEPRIKIRQGNGNGHSSQRGKIVSADRPAPTVVARGNRYSGGTDQFMIESETDIGAFAIGDEWDKIELGKWSQRYKQLQRPALGLPSPTLTAIAATSAAGVVHPLQKRRFSIAELKRICSFPDDFILTGTYTQQWERLGRAVPPLMMAAIATAIRDQIFARLER